MTYPERIDIAEEAVAAVFNVAAALYGLKALDHPLMRETRIKCIARVIEILPASTSSPLKERVHSGLKAVVDTCIEAIESVDAAIPKDTGRGE